MSVSDIQVRDSTGSFKSVFPVTIAQGGTSSTTIQGAQRSLGLTGNEVRWQTAINNRDSGQMVGTWIESTDGKQDLFYAANNSSSLQLYHRDNTSQNWTQVFNSGPMYAVDMSNSSAGVWMRQYGYVVQITVNVNVNLNSSWATQRVGVIPAPIALPAYQTYVCGIVSNMNMPALMRLDENGNIYIMAMGGTAPGNNTFQATGTYIARALR